MKLPIKIALIAGTIAVAGIAAYLVCASGGETPPAKQTVDGQKQKPAGHDAPKAVPQEARGQKIAGDVNVKTVVGAAHAEDVRSESKKAHRAAIEASRREREAFRKMSPEEQQRFREQKREEMRAKRAAHGNSKSVRARLWHEPGEVAAAGADDAPARQDDAAKEKARAKRVEQEELRSAALKARAEYEESMGEAKAAKYRRRSVGYWMNRVKRERERTAARERQSPSQDKGATAGAEASEKPNTHTRKE